MKLPAFLDLPNAEADAADLLLVPLPFEGTVSYGTGTAAGPARILEASTQIELWDEELDFDLDSLQYRVLPATAAEDGESADRYIDRVFETVRPMAAHRGLIVGIGGEHSVTPPLVRAVAANPDDLSDLTVLQIDAHADLRETYEGTRNSHACAMRRLVERGCRLIAVGIRSACRDEMEYGRSTGRVETFFAHRLAENGEEEMRLLETIDAIEGAVYVTIDADGLECFLCPGTGTPQPGGLTWWQTLRYLRCLLIDNQNVRLLGCDLVETVPQPQTQVNEFTSARLLTKVIAYASRGGKLA